MKTPAPIAPTHPPASFAPLRSRLRGVQKALAVAVVGALCLAACGSDDATESGGSSTQPSPTDETVQSAPPSSGPSSGGAVAEGELFPDVLAVEITGGEGGEFSVAATLSSPYDSPERYADAWRVLDPDGNELGVRELGHDHAGEQPFTRSETVTIPDGVDEVTVEGRDQVSGYGGETFTVAVPR